MKVWPRRPLLRQAGRWVGGHRLLILALVLRTSAGVRAREARLEGRCERLRYGKRIGMDKANLVALLHALSGAGALVASPYTQTDLLAAATFIKPLRFGVFGMGMLLFVLATVYLKGAFLGNVEPVTDRLVTTGPYRLVRHPLYLGMFVAVMGLATAFQSLWGMLITLAVFTPAGLWRARLEEEALARTFGQAWERYARRARFVIPFLF